jgi:GNAT superfamily N-acetyltransferase
MVAEVSELYGPINVPGAPTATPEDFSAARGGAFLVVFDEAGAAVAGGGVKRLDDGACEIKRMYVIPEARGRGLASVLLKGLEDEARALGYEIVRLDTGAKQPAAQAMYERAGYVQIGNFNANPFASFWGEKAL